MTQDAATATRDAAAEAVEHAGPGAEVLLASEAQPLAHRLTSAPAIDQLNPRQLALLQAKSPNLTHAELAQALELAVAYQLDPFANEVWFVKGRGDRARLLIMVGRDGLRRIVQRNGLEMHGDLVFTNDVFSVDYVSTPGELAAVLAERGAPIPADAESEFRRLGGGGPFHLVRHRRNGVGAQRGEIVGAWARTWERRTGIERGYFDAGMEEYDRSGQDAYSPWNKQKSVMMLGACERQAARQGTPLGGLIVQGEDRLIEDNERAGDLTAGDPLSEVPRAAEVHDLIARARRLGHRGLADVATAEMTLRGAGEERVGEWLVAGAAELDEMEPPEAEVVQPEPPSEPVTQPVEGDEVARTGPGEPEPQPVDLPEDAEPEPTRSDDEVAAGALVSMRRREQELAEELENAEGDTREDLIAELESVRDTIATYEEPDQGQLI